MVTLVQCSIVAEVVLVVLGQYQRILDAGMILLDFGCYNIGGFWVLGHYLEIGVRLILT